MASSILRRLQTEPTPLIDQDTVTFVWRGKSAPRLVGDFTGWEYGDPFRLEKTSKDVWSYRIRFPYDAYIEYAFTENGDNLADPYNPRQSDNGVGGFNNYFCMPGYVPSRFTSPVGGIPKGRVTTHQISTETMLTGTHRVVHFYQPPVKEPAPLLVVLDGQDYLYRARLNVILDHLIALKRIRPIAAVFINHGGWRSRNLEYSCNDATLGWLITELLPLARENLNLIDIRAQGGQFGILGASMGGLMALYTGLRVHQVFGNVLSQSGAFSMGDFDTVVFDLVQSGEVRPLKIWLDVGLYDIPSLLNCNRRMQSILIERGYPLMYHEYNAGHNFTAWRDDIERGLEAVFGL